MGKKEFINTKVVGYVVTTAVLNGKREKVIFNHVLHPPDIMCNLLSVSKIRSKGFCLIFDEAEDTESARGVYIVEENEIEDIKLVTHETSDVLYDVAVRVRKTKKVNCTLRD